MSCIHMTASTCQLACTHSAFPVQAFQLYKADICKSTCLGTKLPKILKLTSATSRRQQGATVCLFGGKGKSENGDEDSPWKAIEKAVGNFKKEQSVEDVLRQQIQKQEFYDDGGSGGKRPGGGGGGGGEDEDEDAFGMLDEFGQVIMATIGFVFLYIYIIESEEINVLTKDLLRFLFKRQKSIRLRRLMDQWKMFFERMQEKEEYDPYWLEREILNTPTCYDSPAKYWWIMEYLDSNSDTDSRPHSDVYSKSNFDMDSRSDSDMDSRSDDDE